MKYSTIILMFIALFSLNIHPFFGQNNTKDFTIEQGNQLLRTSASLFEENKGQVTGEDGSRVKYTYGTNGMSVFLFNDGISYQFSKTHYPDGYKVIKKSSTAEEREKSALLEKDIRIETYRMDVVLQNANPSPRISSEGKSTDYTQFYNRNTLNVHKYEKITYHNVYPDIDWVVYSIEGDLKYDFVVHPGGNPKNIKLLTRWVEELNLNSEGDLVLKSPMGKITENHPVSFQEGEEINTSFVINENQISFKIDNYDLNKDLIIDPLVRVWATYIGGGDLDQINDCVTDPSGNVFVAGRTASTWSIANGGHDNSYGGGSTDAFLVKFNSAGVRQWGTYYGGSASDFAYGCATDASGNSYMCGPTYSTSGIASGGYDNTHAGNNDAFLVKFNPAGVRLWATYHGGSSFDNGDACATDASGNVYMTGGTESGGIATSGVHKTSGSGNSDAYLSKFNSSGARLWCTYYGGSNEDRYVYGCATDPSGHPYIAGVTKSTNNIASGGAHDGSFGGGTVDDAFLAKFNTSNGQRLWSTYYGNSGFDKGADCTTDASGNVYLAGTTTSTSGIASGGHQNGLGGSSDAYIVKFNSSGSRIWGTYYGGSGGDAFEGCVTDASGNVYAAGWSSSTAGIASGGFQNTNGGSSDGLLIKFNSAGVRQWATYYGGTQFERDGNCAVDASGNTFLAGTTVSTANIASTGAHDTSYGGGSEDGYLVKFSDCIAETNTTSTAAICANATKGLTSSGAGGGTWSIVSGGGSISGTTYTPSSSGSKTIRYVDGCGNGNNVTFTVNPISVAPTSITGTATICSGASTTLTLSGGSAGTGGTAQWYSGSCGGTSAGSGNSISVSPTSTTTYFVRYVGTCNTTTCVSRTVTVRTNSVAPTSISGTTTICAGASTTLSISGGSAGTGATAQWFTGSCGGTAAGTGNSISVSPTSNTTYYVRYSGTCNTTTCASASVTVTALDNASFSYSGTSYCETAGDPSATVTGLAGGSFSINNSGVINSATGSIDLSGSGVGNYVVTYLTNGTCPNSTTANLSITTSPTTGFSYTGSPYCSNGANPTVTFASNASGGVFSSSTTGVFSIDAATGEIDLTATESGTYTVENNIAASGGCVASSSSTSVTITQADNPGYSYSGGTFCLTGTDPTPTISGVSGGSFTSTPAGLSINGSTGEIDLSASLANTYDITYTTPNTCSADSVVQLVITGSPTADFSYPNALYCEDNGGTGVASAVLNPGSSAGVFANLTSTGTLIIDAATGAIDLALSAPGTYTIENNIVAAGGCTADNETTLITITQQDDPAFSYSSTSYCEGDLDPSATITGTIGGTFTSAPAGLTINAATGEIDISASTLDITYTVTYTTNGTCPDSQDASVVINTAPTVPTVGTSVASGEICIGGSLDITASGGGTATSYNVYDALTGGTLLGGTDLTVSPSSTANFYVEAINTAGCAPTTGRELVTVTVNPLPSIDAGTDETICPGEQATLTATGTGTYSWSTAETTQSIDVSPITTTSYTVTLTDANTCVNSDQVVVNVNPTGPILSAVDDDFSVDYETLTNLDVLNNDTLSTTITTVIIDPINGVTDVQTDGSVDYTGNPMYTGSDAFTYIVCEALCDMICDTAVVTISVENNDLLIPGGFSPNDDNINDLFVINGLHAFPNNTLQIFNRWGTAVFIAEPYNNDWDGSSSESGVLIGDKVTTGTYFYILDLGNGSDFLRGSIEVKRD